MLQRRSIRHIGARLALFAVLLQVVLSLGHIHPEDFFPRGVPATAHASSHGPVTPAPAPLPPTHDDCAICASMAMVGGSVLPAPVLLVVPREIGRVAFAPRGPPSFSVAPRLSFRSRAPPLV